MPVKPQSFIRPSSPCVANTPPLLTQKLHYRERHNTMSHTHHVSHPQWGTVLVKPGETLLDACLRVGVHTPFSCRGGSCHTCMLRCTDGSVPDRARKGLSNWQIEKGYFLPCVCEPIGHLRVAPVRPSDAICECRVEDVRLDESDTDAPPIYVLEPMAGLPPLALADEMDISLSDPTHAPDADPALPRAQVVALPQTHYFLEVQLLENDTQKLGAPAVGRSVWVRPARPRGDGATSAAGEARIRPVADPALWAELQDGRHVRVILDAFYRKVFADEQLAPYFQNTTESHAAGKQYAFLYESITGQDVYFGDNPHNAHHTMVISHALFDHRQNLMLETLQEHGLSDNQIHRWTAFEEPFRPDIVKSAPIERIERGQVVPLLEGFDVETLTVGAVCDHCHAIVEPGTPVLYHRRLGTISCPACQPVTEEN